MPRPKLLASLLLASLALCPSANAERLFVLIAGDTSNEVVSDGIQRNMEWIRDTFYSGVPNSQLVVRFLEGQKINQAAILGSIAACPVEEEDTVVFWWLGRCDFEQEERVLLLPDETKLRSTEVRDQLSAKPARLAVMVIDGYQRTLPAAELPEPTLCAAPATEIKPLFRSLFFEPTGMIEIDSAQVGQRPLLITMTGGLLTCGLTLPPGVLGDTNDEPGFLELSTPTDQREIVLERGLLWRDLGDEVRWDTVLSQLRATTSANYRRALGRSHSGSGQTPSFGETRLKYDDVFIEWNKWSNQFRARPRQTRVVREGDRETTYQGEREIHSEIKMTNPIGDLDPDPTFEPEPFEMMPGDHLIEVNGKPIHTEREFQNAMQDLHRGPSEVRFAVIDNLSGRRVEYQTQMNPQTDSNFGIKPWYWKDSLVIVHEVRPGSPAGRAKTLRITPSDHPKEIGLGIHGELIEIDDPFRDGKRMHGILVKSVVDSLRNDLQPGDIVLMIDGCTVKSKEGYRYALTNARQLAGIWIVNGRTKEVEHRHVFLPHTPPDVIAESPEGVESISITPANMESCPIW
ncbi:PDZ domain-containing protein [Novipirellula artificiosorum]|uniref:PDZ domain-containing protein n=1 Tax=Novipirellula artificiosorum TaxID=2528016 RepID=A0A5C6DNH9_9BACT|nr:hypothetical protein [Novipirellula artificiosorum]TWU38278.1 hypothetical protein Poly41_27540 [Novipirellula artificiosorum]